MLPFSQYTDNELIALLADDDQAAFSEIYRRNWQELYNGAFKRLRDEDQCKDIVQNIFSDLWERRKQGLNIQNLPAYLHTAVRFQVIRQVTRQPKHAEFIDTFDAILTSPLHSDEPMLEKEILDLVKCWIDALPEKRRAIFLMFYEGDMSTAEIAEHLGISVKTVQNQLNTAGNTLRTRLSQVLTLQIVASFLYLR